jgi:urease gamma subunit
LGHLTGSGLSMHLTPCEVDKLISFTTGEVARRRRARGLRPNHDEMSNGVSNAATFPPNTEMTEETFP